MQVRVCKEKREGHPKIVGQSAAFPWRKLVSWKNWAILGALLCTLGREGRTADFGFPPSNDIFATTGFSAPSSPQAGLEFPKSSAEGIPPENLSPLLKAPEDPAGSQASAPALEQNRSELPKPNWALEVAKQKERIRQKAETCPAGLRPLAESILRWVSRAETLLSQYQETANQLTDVQSQRNAIQQQFQRTQQKVEAVGQTHSIGLLLRKQRAALPDPKHIQGQIQARQLEIQTITLELFDYQDRRAELNNLSAEVQRQVQLVGPPPEGTSPQQWQRAIEELLLWEREQIDWLLPILHRYFEILVELDHAQTELVRLVDQYRAYVDERVLWIRSTTVFGPKTLRHTAGAIAWLVQWEHGRQLAQAFLNGVQTYPLAVGLGLVVLGIWGYTVRVVRRRMAQIGEQVQRDDFFFFLPTLRTAAMAGVVAGFRPAVLWLVPWCLGWTITPTELVRSVGETLQRTALVLLPWELLLAVCQPNGLAESHFRWPQTSVRVLRQGLRTWMAVATACFVVTAFFHSQNEERWDSSLGRGAFLLLMVVSAGAICWLLRAKSPFIRGFLAQEQVPTWLRFRPGLYWFGLLGPLGLGVLAGGGYYYTAQQLAVRLCASVVVVIGFGLLGAILRRGILILRRRMVRNQTQSVPQPSEPPPGYSEPTSPPPEPKPSLLPDLVQPGLQAERLLGSLLILAAILAIGMIWMDILPALAMLKQIPLWAISWEGVATGAPTEGPSGIQMVDRVHWVSLADLLWAVVVLLMTYIAAKNLPGLLELFLPQKLPLDQGTRYALKTLIRYGVVLSGLLIGLPPLGITWNRMQWLVAALGVGLGFGLQEIFANFISGLILLFERPIRIGDIVTVGDVSGVVSKIHTRATIITNWDRQDLIVPNKEFITGRVLNWTLSNPVNRIVIELGVPYGCDTERVRTILEEIVRNHPEVLQDPSPLISLEKFGESSLGFVIRAYLPTLDKRARTIHELYTAIHRRFCQEGIEIPFPQRDVHIRSWPPGGSAMSSTS